MNTNDPPEQFSLDLRLGAISGCQTKFSGVVADEADGGHVEQRSTATPWLAPASAVVHHVCDPADDAQKEVPAMLGMKRSDQSGGPHRGNNRTVLTRVPKMCPKWARQAVNNGQVTITTFLTCNEGAAL